MMRILSNHVQAAILRGISDHLDVGVMDRQKAILIVESLHSTDWASATFVGATHELNLRLEGPADAIEAALARLATIGEREFAIAGHILADIACTCDHSDPLDMGIVAVSLTVNALTIID